MIIVYQAEAALLLKKQEYIYIYRMEMYSNSTVDIVANNNTTRIYQQRDINVAIKREIFPVVIYRKKRKGTERDLSL